MHTNTYLGQRVKQKTKGTVFFRTEVSRAQSTRFTLSRVLFLFSKVFVGGAGGTFCKKCPRVFP